MEEAVASTTSERGWGKLLLALVAFLIVPVMPPFRVLLPVEETLLLLLPALAACCLVGWWAGGRFLLAILWVGLATWYVLQPGGPDAAYNLACGWTLLLSGAFGLVCMFGSVQPFFPRALAAMCLALFFALVLSARGPVTPSRVTDSLRAEYSRRNAESAAQLRLFIKDNAKLVKLLPETGSRTDEVDRQLHTFADAGVSVFPSMLLLESLVALALAWATFHRLSRTRLGAPLGLLKEFRFNDQLVWGLIVGLAIVFVPALDFLQGTGRNLLVFFGALYAIRGLGVLSWFLAPGALVVSLFVGFAMLFWPLLNTIAVLGFVLLTLAAFGLGLGDTWADWRRRARPTT